MRREKGSVTVFAAMSFMIIASVICAMIESSRVQGARVLVAMAADMALDGMFSGYEKELLDEYGVLLWDGADGADELDSDHIAAQLKECIEKNLDTDGGLYFTRGTDFYGVEIDEVCVDNVITAPDAYGLVWRRMIDDYAKLDYGVGAIEDVLGLDGLEQENNVVTTAVDYIDDCMEQVSDFYSTYLKLIEHIDGIKTESNGVNFTNLRTRNVYVKAINPGNYTEISQEALSINEYRVYEKVAQNMFDIQGFAGALFQKMDEVMKGMTFYVDDVKSMSFMLRDFLQSLKTELEVSMRLVEDIMGKSSLIENKFSAAVNYLSSISDISMESMEGLYDELRTVEDERNRIVEKLGDAEALYEILEYNYEIVSAAYDSCTDIGTWGPVVVDRMDVIECRADYMTAMEKIRSYRTDGMYLDYEGIECRKGDDSVLGCVYDYTMGGLLEMVLPKGTEVSEKSIGNMRLADMYGVRGDRGEYIEDELTDVMNEILLNMYLGDKFRCYTDKQQNRMLDYEQEYILCGKDSDKKNLEGAVLAIAGVRFGCNMTYLFTDVQKKQEAYNIALAALGFTGIITLVKALEYLILTAWAIGETVVDMKLLLKGDKVPLIKKREDWKLELGNMLGGVLDAESRSEQKGLDYSQYLTGMMLITNPQEKAFRSMALVEMHMIKEGVQGFLLKNYIYGMDISVTYHVGGRREIFTEHCSYTY